MSESNKPYQIITFKNKLEIQEFNLPCAGHLFAKMKIMCNKINQTCYWGDHLRSVKVKKDPVYVVLRNSVRSKTQIVLIEVDDAPDNYIAELSKIYNWKLI